MSVAKTKKKKKKAKRKPMPELNKYEKEGAEKWTEKVQFKKSLLIEAKSYNEWVDQQMPMVSNLKTDSDAHKCKRISIGSCELYRRIFSTHKWGSIYANLAFFVPLTGFNWVRNGLQIAQGITKEGMVYFTDHVNIPILTRPSGGPWMSLTPNEIMTLRPGVRKAKGNVVIAGLGMGWMARKVCEKKGIKSVTIVETDPDIAKYFGDLLKKDFPDVKIVVADAWNYLKRRASKFDSHLFDIWESYGHRDQKFRDFQEKRPQAWAWGYYLSW